MKLIYIAALCLLFSCSNDKSNTNKAETKIENKATKKDSNKISLGQEVPSFVAISIDGETINIDSLKGKVVLLNFFATWCPPCQKEIPHLEKDVWAKFKDKDFRLISFAREHKSKEILKFRKDKNLSFSLVADSTRAVYSKFAESGIPRNYIISKEGKVIFVGSGYDEKELAKIIKTIEENL